MPLALHYLAIDWLGPGRARHVTVSPEPIEIEPAARGALVAQTQAFHDWAPWVGLRLTGEMSGVVPVASMPDGQSVDLMRIQDTQGGQWWVHAEAWDPHGRRHLSEMHRTMGRFTVKIGKKSLHLDNVVENLRLVQVQDYLNDFKADLIWLALGMSGASAQTGRGGGLPSAELAHAIERFVAAVSRVLANPARHVREAQDFDRPGKLRPNTATFREYLQHPLAKRLPGRIAEETADIADNRYLRHLVQVCDRIAQSISRSAKMHAERFAEREKDESERSLRYRAMKHRDIDPEVFDRQTEQISRKLDDLSSLDKPDSDSDVGDSDWAFKPTRLRGKSPNEMFFEYPGKIPQGDELAANVEFNVLVIPEALAKCIVALGINKTYTLRGKRRTRRCLAGNGKPYREVTFTEIHQARPSIDLLQRRKEDREKFERNGWRVELTGHDRREMATEAKMAQFRAKSYARQAQLAGACSESLAPSRRSLSEMDAAWERMGVGTSSIWPMGVRFSQSPSYAACLAAFSEVQKVASASGLGAESLESVEDMSLLHASALYERWCLVKILKVLMEDYCFEPEVGWQEPLIRAVTGKPQSHTLRMRRADLGIMAVLDVQPELPNGRRPDFRLHFARSKGRRFALPAQVQGSASSEESTRWEWMKGSLVMDAKFRTRWKGGDLAQMVDTLTLHKDYGIEEDRVFILHPAPRAISVRSSPLAWGAYCDYGQAAGALHRQGSVYLAPDIGEISPDQNLRRLFAIQLQALFPEPESINEGYGGTRTSLTSSFCVRCGRAHAPDDVQERTTKGGGKSWTFTCAKCETLSTRTHCYNCRHTTIHKNGLTLTYHQTVAQDITNILCPNCGSYFEASECPRFF